MTYAAEMGQLVDKLYDRAARNDDDLLFDAAEALSGGLAESPHGGLVEITEFEARMARRIIALLSVRHGDWSPFMALREYHKIVDAIEYDYNQLVKGKVDA